MICLPQGDLCPRSALRQSGAAFIVLLLFSWLSTGTLAPYAASHHLPRITDNCGYLVNLDDGHFISCFQMIAGEDSSMWKSSVALRRIVYPLFAFPLVYSAGYEMGGFLANLLLLAAAFWLFALFLGRRYGLKAQIAGSWLLCSYPGIMYWVGLPYSYATIVPFSIISFILVQYVEENRSVRRAVFAATSIGVLSLGYDIIPFFGLTLILVLASMRRWFQIPAALIGLILPSILSNWLLFRKFGVSLVNSNTQTVGSIISSYFHVTDYAKWWELVRNIPTVFIFNYFFSNFLFLPLAFLIIILAGFRNEPERLKFPLTEKCLLLSGLCVFLFNNLAPPYEGWQLRGNWIARLYQPLFVVFMVYAARATTVLSSTRRIIGAAVIIFCVFGNTAVILGPWINQDLTGLIYHNFYKHAPASAYRKNLSIFGRRPFGFCRPITDNKLPNLRARR